MTNVNVRGLLATRRKQVRKAVERTHHIANELQDKQGRCYTYRGVQYCYE